MKKSILILFVLLSQVCMGQSLSGLSHRITITSLDLYIYESIDSVSTYKPSLIITIHEEYRGLTDNKKVETLAKMEAWILLEKKKLKK